MIMEHKGDLHPQIVIEDDRGQILDVYYIPRRPTSKCATGRRCRPARCWPRRRARCRGTQDITGGLPRVTEIFEARRPRDPAVMAEIAGKVRLGEKKRGKRLIYVQPVDDDGKPIGEETRAPGAAGQAPRVHTGDYVKDGDPLVDGPLVPHDILRISGIEAVQDYLVREVQAVYRSQRVDIDDKHIEIIVVADAAQGEGRDDAATPACCPAR